MAAGATFDELLEAVEHLSPDEQADLIVLIQRRLAELGRKRVVADVREGRLQYQNGSAKPVGVDDLNAWRRHVADDHLFHLQKRLAALHRRHTHDHHKIHESLWTTDAIQFQGEFESGRHLQIRFGFD